MLSEAKLADSLSKGVLATNSRYKTLKTGATGNSSFNLTKQLLIN
jgi:hypothetical protein